jgi:D-alanine-D-alanine ligase
MATIALIHDAAAAEGRPDSSDTLVEAAAIAAALRELGHDTEIVPVGLDLERLERRLRALGPSAVFNLVESLGLPLTGCPSSALASTSDKQLAKTQLKRAGLATPAEPADRAAAETRWIVKAVWEHASLGIDDSSVVALEDVAATLAARRAEFGGDWFAEAYLPGRELNVGLIAGADGRPRVLPIAEIRFDDFPADKPHIVGYAAKWDEASFEYRSTPRSFAVERDLAARAAALALECWDLFGLAGYARVDLRVPTDGVPSVLEINANPCLSPDAGFAAALREAGIAYRDAVGILVEDARRRAGVTHGS